MDFELAMMQATKLDDLFLALSAAANTTELSIIQVDKMGGIARKSVIYGASSILPQLDVKSQPLVDDFLCQAQVVTTSIEINGKSFALYKLMSNEPQKLFLICPSGKVSDTILRRFAHEWSWHKRLENSEQRLMRDDLTGLYNTRYMDLAIDQELLRAQRFNLQFSILFIDLDNFKHVNDKYGHLCGSSLLKVVSQQLTKAVREIDSVIRYGGDEFVIILIGASPAKAMKVAERARRFINNAKIEEFGQSISVTASIGIASHPIHGSTRDALLAAADESMYRSKSLGKNCVALPVLEPNSKGQTYAR
jgi:diguanylate cyclase (GGDEF)-like protein